LTLSRCPGKFVAPGKFFPPPYCHNVTNANPNPNPNPNLNPSPKPNSNLNPTPNPNPYSKFNPILNLNPNLYDRVWEFSGATNFPLHRISTEISDLLPSSYSSKPPRQTQPGHPSVGK